VNPLKDQKIQLITFTLVVLFILSFLPISSSYAEQETGSIVLSLGFPNGDIAGGYGTALKIFQDFEIQPLRIETNIEDYPFTISPLPLGHDYKIEIYKNDMFSGYGLINLVSQEQELNLVIKSTGGNRI